MDLSYYDKQDSKIVFPLLLYAILRTARRFKD